MKKPKMPQVAFSADLFATPAMIVKRVLLIVIGSAIMAVNLNSFVHAGGLFPGGFSGLTILIQEIAAKYAGLTLSYAVVNILLNAPLVAVSFLYIGRKFTILSLLSVVLTGVFTDLIPSIDLTNDILLLSIFGGGINAIAVTFCLKAGACSGGTDFVSILVSQKYGIDAWNYIFCFNVALLMLAGYLFGWDRALYSILFQFASTQALNSLYRRYKKVTLLVITNDPQTVYTLINEETHHDATVFTGTGAYTGSEKNLVYSVVGGDEVQKIVPKIKKEEPKAFINVIRSNQILGTFYSKPND